MSAILIIANDFSGPVLRADLGGLGHTAWFVDRARLMEAEMAQPPDLTILDAEAVGDELGTVCRTLRGMEATRRTPILVIVGHERARDLDLSCGIDDFQAKPYDPCELGARIRLMLWRDGRLGQKDVIKVGDILINLTRYEVRVRGVPVELTLKEYELLKYLVMNRGRVFTRSDLLNRIWGYNYYGGMRTVDVHIRRVRSKLEGSGDIYIKTIRGVGYRFEPLSREDDG